MEDLGPIPPDKYLPADVWQTVLRAMPIPCVDLILVNPNKEILYGYRRISPYKECWSLIGGRILRGESAEEAVDRQAKHYGAYYLDLQLNGVFNINFGFRSDIAISYVAKWAGMGEPQPREEFTSFRWMHSIPAKIGALHRKEVQHWLNSV